MPKRFTLRLEDRLIILVVTLTILIMFAVTLVTIRRERRGIELEMRNKAKDHSEILAMSNVEEILKKDYLALGSAVEEVIKRDPDIAYVAIYDKEGRTMTRSLSTTLNERDFPVVSRVLREPLKVISVPRMERIQLEKGEFLYDTTVPIRLPEWEAAPVGVVRIGFSTSRIKERIKDIRDQNILLTVIFVYLSMVGALILGKIMNKQINTLITARAAPVREIAPEKEYDLEKEFKRYFPEYGEKLAKGYKELSPQQLLSFFRAAGELSTARNMEEVLKLSTENISNIMGVAELLLLLKDEETGELKAKVGYDSSGPLSEEALTNIRVKERGEVWMASQFGTSSMIDFPKPGSGIVVPLMSKEKTIGVIEIRDRLSGGPFKEKEQLLLELLGDLISSTIEKVKTQKTT